MTKRTEITIETERLLVVSQRRGKTVLWCNGCEKDVPMLTVPEAARAKGTTRLVISELAQAGRLHFAVSREGQHFICPNSLAAARA